MLSGNAGGGLENTNEYIIYIYIYIYSCLPFLYMPDTVMIENVVGNCCLQMLIGKVVG